MIKRLLIANRGEIALRVIRACRELDVETVAVYSDADTRAPHVAAADRAILLGPAPASESYLAIPRVIEATRTSGADAVHPGYGFLSENAEFAGACEQAGLTFVGPPSSVIARMGSKIVARRLAQDAGVPVVPGETPDDQSDESLRRAIERLGFPSLIKPSSGGGGKGMHRVRHPGEAAEAIQAARREATAAFGNGTLYVERVLERPRHIEVQIFGDRHGNVVHLFERECSVQRRHQKVIEETPSVGLTPAVRHRITEAAVRVATAVGYRNAGTVEFLVDAADGVTDEAPFYFLEMNTRLQVEHPVSEAVVGVDLVRAQLRVASGEPLPWAQTDLSQRGHAIEARVYAEDPACGFLPQAGRVLLYREPRLPGVRIDSGVDEGSDVPIEYDPLLAKVIARAESRELARLRLMAALRDFPILGLHTNVPFLLRILEHPRFQRGDTDTALLDVEGAAFAAASTIEAPAFIAAALAAAAGGQELSPGRHESWDPWTRIRNWQRHE